MERSLKKTIRSSSYKKKPGAIRPRSHKNHKKTATPWDQAAQWYDSLVGLKGSDFQKEIIMPGAFRMLGLKKAQRVLDLACGQGVFSRYLHQKGMRVTGLDSSRALIRYAVKRSSSAINDEEGDAVDPHILKGRKFDAVACLLAIQNMATIDAMMKNVHRWLAPSGRLVLVMTHPCFRIPRQTHWGWDEEKKAMYRRVDLYSTEIKIPILTPPMRGSEVYTQTYHRSLQSYFQSLSQVGLQVDSLEEWASNKNSEPGRRAKAENRVRREIPLFMALSAVVAG